MKILLIGRRGQLARELLRAEWPAGTEMVALGRDAIDLSHADGAARALDEAAPDLLINAAAYTEVDNAETDSDAAFALNRDAPRYLAAAAARCGARMIHISTDYVFGGSLGRPWREDDAPDPLNLYGRSKLAGEEAVRSVLARHLILRSSWIFAAHGRNFVRSMLRLGAERPELKIVGDQTGCPTAAADLARAVVALACAESTSGTYHYSGAGPVSWFEFAEAIFELAGDLVKTPPRLRRIAGAEFGAAAARPAYSVLDCGKIARDSGIVAAPWRRGLVDVLAEIRAEGGVGAC